jgi:type I restriction enzyme, S subunit
MTDRTPADASQQHTTLGAIVKSTGGVVQTGPFGSQLHASDYVQTGTPLVMPINLGDNVIIESGIARIGPQDARRLTRHALRENDIVFSRRGDVGRRSIVRREQAGWICGTGCFAARFGPKLDRVDPKFVALYLGSLPAQAWLQNNAVGGTMPNLNTSILASTPVALPPKPYQEKVVEILDDAAYLVATLERLIAKKQSIKQGMMQQLLSGKTRLAGYTADSSGSVGARLSEISGFITKGATPTTYGYKWQDSGIVFLRSECVSPHGLDLRQAMFISEAAHRSLQRSQVADGDILMTITGYVGRVVRLHGVGVANINQHIARIRVRDKRFDSGFVYHYLSQKDIREHYESITTGQAYPQISLTQVRNTFITAPPINIQRKVAQALDDIDTQIAKLSQLLTKCIGIQQGMMQELLTGRTRLPVAEALA